MGAIVASCTDLTTDACLSFQHVNFPRKKTGHFLIMVLSPVPDPELIPRKYLLKDTDLAGLIQQTTYTTLWYEELTHSGSLIRAEVRPNVLLKLQKVRRTHRTSTLPTTPTPPQPMCQEWSSENPNTNPKACPNKN